MSYFIAIDVGIVNLGLCVYNTDTEKIVLWDCVPLRSSGGKYYPCKNVEYVREFMRRYADYFDDARKVLVERQMRCNMRIIEAVFEALNHDRCLVIHPRSIKAHYKLSGKDYRDNKAKAVEWARAYVQDHADLFAPHATERFASGKKQDDLADALLLLIYYIDTFSESDKRRSCKCKTSGR